MAAVGSCPLPILFLPEAPLLPISASESPSFGPGPPLSSLLACLIQSSCPSTAILVCLTLCLPSRPSFRPHCSSLLHQLLPASPNLQVTQGIILITLLSLGPLLGTQGAEQCTIPGPPSHQAHPSPPATLSTPSPTRPHASSRSCPSVDHLLERADPHTPRQVLLTQYMHACLPHVS